MTIGNAQPPAPSPATVKARMAAVMVVSSVPVLVIAAGRSQAQDPGRLARRARDLLPGATTQTLALASHHSIPTEDAADLAAAITRFPAPEDNSRLRRRWRLSAGRGVMSGRTYRWRPG
jgi:hypothetical protein